MSEQLEMKILQTDSKLTDAAFERFTEGKINQEQLREFYEVLHDWSLKSCSVLEMAQRIGIET